MAGPRQTGFRFDNTTTARILFGSAVWVTVSNSFLQRSEREVDGLREAVAISGLSMSRPGFCFPAAEDGRRQVHRHPWVRTSEDFQVVPIGFSLSTVGGTWVLILMQLTPAVSLWVVELLSHLDNKETGLHVPCISFSCPATS